METEFLQRTFLGNTVENYIWVSSIILIGLIFKQVISKLFSWILFRIFKRYSGAITIEQFHNLLKKPFSIFILLVIGYVAFNQLTFPEEWRIGPEHQFGVRMVIQ